MAVTTQKLGRLDWLFVGILLVVFGGIILHAPMSVWLSSLFPSAELFIKSWKEILLIVAAVLAGLILFRKKQWGIYKNPLILLVLAYAVLHLLLLPLSWQGLPSAIAGLIIDLRYLLFFVLVYTAVHLYPTLRKPFIITFFVGAFIVAAFALLQVFVLPPDILKYIGYNKETISPFLTVDENPEFVRINSTLRGPNPLGAYAGIVLALLFAFWLRGSHTKIRRPVGIISVILIGSFVALWASYSRSALFAAFAALGIVFAVTIAGRFSRKVWGLVIVAAIILCGTVVTFRDSPFVSTVLLHESITTGAETNSNEGHVDSLQDGISRMIHQSLGGGIGSTGSASLLGNEPLIIENQYLFIAHEAGWIGFVLFIVITWKVLRMLWQQRKDWLALGVFASGIGLVLIGLLLPVWVDDTVSIIWWGLAAIVIGGVRERAINKTTKRTA